MFTIRDFFLAYVCVFLVVTLITSKFRKGDSATWHYSSTAPMGWSEISNEHANGISVVVFTTLPVYGISL